MAEQERRSAPRLKDEGMTLKLNMDGFNMVTHTLDISASGVYCKVDKEIPLMSRVKLVLMVPEPSRAELDPRSVEVDGVVVREHPVIINGETKHYDVAIFFENTPPKLKEIISNYIAGKKGT